MTHPNRVLPIVQDAPGYVAISRFYGKRTAKRSGVPLINHIHEGIAIIDALDGVLPDGREFNMLDAAQAYCLHPLFQNDAELTTFGLEYASMSPRDVTPLVLVMEYRARANAWLSDKVQIVERAPFPPTQGCFDMIDEPEFDGRPDAGPLPEVWAMLIADKVQNYKDFLAHHEGTHARSDELGVYFRTWLAHLGVLREGDDSIWQRLVSAAEAV